MRDIPPLFGTMHYYDEHAEEYAEFTVNADMSHAYEKFLRYLTVVADDSLSSGREQKWLNVVLGKR